MNSITSMEEQFITKLTQIIDENLQDENFGANELAEQLGMSRVTLYRKVKSIVKKSVSEFIRETRLQRSLELLKNKAGTVSEISYKVGFRSPVYFNKCFRDYFGVTPGDVLKGIQVINEEKQEQKIPFTKKQLQFFSMAVILVLVVFVVYFFMPPYVFRQSNSDKNKIVIAIPPFTDNDTFSNNTELKIIRTELYGRLCQIPELFVIPPDIWENNKYNNLTTIEMGKKLNADFICKGNRLESGNSSKIYLDLIDVKNNAVIFQPNFVLDTLDIWKICAEYILEITDEFKIPLSPTLKKAIIKKPSENPAALLLYQNGIAELEKSPGFRDIGAAKRLFESALERDSTIAGAYVRLAHIYLDLLAFMENDLDLKQNYFDSAKVMADCALKYDPENSWAYSILATYCLRSGFVDEAQKNYKLKEKYSLRNSGYYQGNLFWYHMTGDHYKAAVNGIKYIQQLPENSLPKLKELELLWFNLTILGFSDEAVKYIEIGKNQIPNKKWSDYFYLGHMAMNSQFNGNFEDDKKFLLEQLKLDSLDKSIYDNLIKNALFKSNFNEAYSYAKTYYELFELRKDSIRQPDLNFGFAFLEAGEHDKAMFHIQYYLDYFKALIDKNKIYKYENYMYLAGIYAALNEKKDAIECLKEIKNANSNYGWLMFGLTYHYSFSNYRDTNEFKDVYNYIEKQYLKEQKRMKEFLVREDMLES